MGKSKDDILETEGKIIEMLPAGMFKIKLDSGQEIHGHLAGKLRQFKIRLMIGDRVRVEMSTYDLTKGRINFRF
jgi:translation initiation factor IF-1